MLTLVGKRAYGANDVAQEKYFILGYCLSTDEKPTNVKNGSQLYEMDTSTRYVFDEENLTWLEVVGGGGGGGEIPSHVLFFDNNGNSYTN